jgi:Sulfotransferase family
MTQGPIILFGVGATKAGTSWLYEQLAAHPDCHFRTIKELHYFNTMQGTPDARMREHSAEKNRLKGRLAALPSSEHARLRRRIADLRDWIGVLTQRAEDMAAYRAYLLGGLSGQHVVGDVTPAYATLSPDVLQRMAASAPDVRFIYLMRDPVARLWSHVRMLARRENADLSVFAQVASARFDTVVASDPTMDQRGDYIGAMTKLRDVVAPERLLAMFSEDLMTPDGMARLWAFLGLAPVVTDFAKRVHEGTALAMTDAQRARAQMALRPQYDFVADAFAVLPDAWRKNMKEATV